VRAQLSAAALALVLAAFSAARPRCSQHLQRPVCAPSLPSTAAQAHLVLAVGDVDVALGVPVLLGQPKIDDVHLVGLLAQPHEEVVGLDVAVDEGARVDKLDARQLGVG